MKAEEFELSLDGGVTLHAYRWEPEDGAKAVIQIVHGMAEYAARYARFAEAATANGYAVAAVDLRGHGKSTASPDDWGFFAERDGWNKVVGDLAAQRKRITIEYPDLPVFLLGHSMGSFLAQQLMIEHGGEYAGVILSASNGPVGPLGAVGAFIARLEVLRLGPKGISGLLGAMSFGTFNKPYKPPRTDFDWLSRDEAEVDKYVADPLCGFDFRTSSWRDMIDALGRLYGKAKLARIPKDLPVFILAGTNDPVGNMTKGVDKLIAVYRSTGLTAVESRYYDGARHEILNETNRDEVTADILGWLDRLALPV